MTPRLAGLLTVGVIAGVMIWRGGVAIGGDVPVQRAAAEVLAVAGGAAMVWLMWRHAGGGRRISAIQLVATTVWAGGVLAPLWMTSHPPRVIASDVLGGARRELRSEPSQGGLHWLEVTRPDGATTTSYWLQLQVGERRTTARRRLGEGSNIEAVMLAAGARAVIFIERADGPLAVRLAPAPPDRRLVLVALAFATLLALIADAFTARRVPRLAGATTAVTVATAIAVLLLEPSGTPSATATLGRVLVAAVGGAFAGGVWGIVAARLGPRDAVASRRK